MKSGLGLLPLLDVFMVVLFVFATIQEGELDSSEQQNEELEAQIVEAQVRAESEALRAATLEAELKVESREAERAQMLEEQLEQFREACGPRQPGDPLCPAASADARQLVEMSDVQARVLGAVSVVEIEIGGEADLEAGRLIERCCFRTDPPEGKWSSCGELPRTRQDREDWFDAGADGLRESLRTRREGGTVVLLRQSEDASHNAGSDLAALLRARLPEAYIYDENGVTEHLLCPLLEP